MFCKNCGTKIADYSIECPVCHTTVTPQAPPPNSTYNQPQYSGCGTANGGYNQSYIQYRDTIEKGNNAKTLALVGLILGVITSPIFGWIMGGIALPNAKRAYALTGDIQYKSAISLAKWAIGVSIAIAIVHIIFYVLIFATSMFLDNPTYYGFNSYSSAIPSISAILTNYV